MTGAVWRGVGTGLAGFVFMLCALTACWGLVEGARAVKRALWRRMARRIQREDGR
jgi:hypothetical protein